MDSRMVYVKTDKGHEEIEKRTYHLNFKHRTALILVDGESAANELLDKIPGDGLMLLDELLRDGFIAAAQGGASAPVAQEPGPSPADAGAFDLDAAKRGAVKVIEALMGPGGESLAVSIERSKTRAEFAQHAQKTRDIVSQMFGARKAAEFWAKTGL